MLKVCLLLLLIFVGSNQARDATAYESLRTDLLTSYKIVRPGSEAEGALKVYVFFYLYKLLGLDGKDQVLRTSAQLHLQWQDSRLSWEEDNYNGTTLISLASSDIWIPAIGLRNSVNVFFDKDAHDAAPVYIYNNGLVKFDILMEYESSCDLNMRWFPFDIQDCSLNFGTLSQYLPLSVNISESQRNGSSVDFTYYTASKEFSLTQAYTSKTGHYEDVEDVDGATVKAIQPELQIWFRIARKPAYFALNIIIPVICLALLSMLTFMVPIESGEKMGMAITVLLSFAVFMLLLSDLTPEVSKNIPVITIYLALIISTCCLNIIIQTWILSIYHVYPVRPLPKFLRKLTKCLTPRHTKHNKLKEDRNKPNPQPNGNLKQEHKIQYIPSAHRHNARSYDGYEEQYRGQNGRSLDGYGEHYRGQREERYHKQDGYGEHYRGQRGERYHNQEMTHPVTAIKEPKKEQSTDCSGHKPKCQEDVWEDEWKTLAHWLDSTFFVASCVLNLLAIIGLFCITFPLKMQDTLTTVTGRDDSSPDYGTSDDGAVEYNDWA